MQLVMVVLMLSSNSISVECIVKVILKVRMVNMDLCDIWANISETVHSMTNVSMKHIYEVIYISVYLIDFGWRLKVK